MAAKGTVQSVAALIAVLLLTAADWGSWKRFHGTVVDAETGKPIADAVVVFEWVKRHRLGMDGPEYVQNVQEVVTDAAGRYSVEASPGINWNPITYLYRLDVVIFAPGYKPAAPAFVVIKGAEYTMDTLAALEMGTVTRLQPLTPSSRIRQMLDPGVLGIADDARHRVPKLTRVINEERRRLGFQEISPRD